MRGVCTTATTTATTTASSTATAVPIIGVESQEDALSTGAIVGIAVGGVAVLGIGSFFAIKAFFPKAGDGFILH